MVQRISFTMPNGTYDRYLSNYPGNNKSAFITEMMIQGIEYSTGELANQKTQILDLHNQLRTKDAEIHKLKLEVGRLKQLCGKEMHPSVKMAKAFKNAGFLERGT